MESKYKTIETISESQFKEKGSKFIGYAVACYNETEAKNFLESWRKKHFQARHVCYAYRFGLDKKTFRYNDDGEPNNSAGAPIFGQIQSYDLTNVLIGVVRYFGGTKLGVGGLIQAYKAAAKEAIDSGTIIELEVYHWVKLNFPYEHLPQMMSMIKKYALHSQDQNFDNTCELVLRLPLNNSESILNELMEMKEINIEEKGIY